MASQVSLRAALRGVVDAHDRVGVEDRLAAAQALERFDLPLEARDFPVDVAVQELDDVVVDRGAVAEQERQLGLLDASLLQALGSVMGKVVLGCHTGSLLVGEDGASL